MPLAFSVIPMEMGIQTRLLAFCSRPIPEPRFRGCVILRNIALRGIILRAKALAYIDNGQIIHSLFLSICLSDHVAQGFNPAKADCDTTSSTMMTCISFQPSAISRRQLWLIPKCLLLIPAC